MINPIHQTQRHKIIKNQIRQDNNTIYGARSMNAQLPTMIQRPTEDYDVLSKTPKQSARKLEKALDANAGYDAYYTKPAEHKGTHKVISRGMVKGNKADDYTVADFTNPSSYRDVRRVKQNNLSYAHISERKKDALNSLNNPAYSFRHEKDRDDLNRINFSQRWRRLFK